jgi:hypothetical protein
LCVPGFQTPDKHKKWKTAKNNSETASAIPKVVRSQENSDNKDEKYQSKNLRSDSTAEPTKDQKYIKQKAAKIVGQR